MNGNVKIEILQGVQPAILEMEVNKFISNKKVIDIRTNTNYIGVDYSDPTEITITVIYEETK